jgi:hypothetical protein
MGGETIMIDDMGNDDYARWELDLSDPRENLWNSQVETRIKNAVKMQEDKNILLLVMDNKGDFFLIPKYEYGELEVVLTNSEITQLGKALQWDVRNNKENFWLEYVKMMRFVNHQDFGRDRTKVESLGRNILEPMGCVVLKESPDVKKNTLNLSDVSPKLNAWYGRGERMLEVIDTYFFHVKITVHSMYLNAEVDDFADEPQVATVNSTMRRCGLNCTCPSKTYAPNLPCKHIAFAYMQYYTDVMNKETEHEWNEKIFLPSFAQESNLLKDAIKYMRRLIPTYDKYYRE